MKNNKVKKIVKDAYKKIAKTSSSCCCNSAKNISKSIGYSDEELKIAGKANLGLGCGNPLAFGNIREGDTVLDLGSGAGMDAILAAKKVGSRGRVIGVDMTKEMVEKAKENAKKQGITNVEFLLGEIEDLPLKDSSVDTIITNCVINLTPDKAKTFNEAFRVLKQGGRIYLSDIVLLKELTKEQRDNKELISGCVAGALLRDDYLNKIKGAGFKVKVLYENTSISKRQYNGIPLESITVELTKIEGLKLKAKYGRKRALI